MKKLHFFQTQTRKNSQSTRNLTLGLRDNAKNKTRQTSPALSADPLSASETDN